MKNIAVDYIVMPILTAICILALASGLFRKRKQRKSESAISGS